MSQDFLGEFEQMVLLSIMRLGKGAYGLAIKDELESVAGRSPSSQRLVASSEAPRIEFPAIHVIRDADTEPESPPVAVSEKSART